MNKIYRTQWNFALCFMVDHFKGSLCSKNGYGSKAFMYSHQRQQFKLLTDIFVE